MGQELQLESAAQGLDQHKNEVDFDIEKLHLALCEDIRNDGRDLTFGEPVWSKAKKHWTYKALITGAPGTAIVGGPCSLASALRLCTVFVLIHTQSHCDAAGLYDASGQDALLKSIGRGRGCQ